MRIHLRFLSLASVLAALVAAPSAAFAGPVVIKMATLIPEGSSWHRIMKESADRWAKISNGQVKVIIYPGGTQGDDPDLVRKMRLGTLNAALLSSVGVGEIEKAVWALSVPMAYNDYDEMYYVHEKLRPKLEASMAEKGFVVLNWADAGWGHFFSVKPVKTPDDMRALKLFVWAGDTKSIEIWRSAGFNPVPLPGTELATALQTGLVNAFTAPPQLAVITRQYENAKYMTDMKWGVLLGATVVNKAVWERIPEALRPQLLAESQETGKLLQKEVRESEAKDVEAMKKRGLTVVDVDAKTKELWRQAVAPTYPKMRSEFMPPWAYDEAMQYRDEYRKAHPAAKK
jgi:TRAP-type C4-dicarboxylate transport system substrate-binding protein